MTRPVVIAATIPAHIFRQPEHRLWESWIYNAYDIRKSHPEGVEYLLVLEDDARNRYDRPSPDSPIEGLRRHVDHTLRFQLDDGRAESTTANRQVHIVFGQNLAAEHALNRGADLFMVGASVHLPAYVLPSLFNLRNATQHISPPIVGPYVSSYAQYDPRSNFATERNGRHYFQGLPAGAVLIPNHVLRSGLRWRTHSGMSDDFTLVEDALRVHGVPSFVALDLTADKFPATVIPLEQRPYDRRTT